MSWSDGLSPAEREVWDRWVDHTRRDTVEKIAGSAAVAVLHTGATPEEVDVQAAVELGAAIYLDKPIVILAPPGATVPSGLLRVATRVVYADPDTGAGQRAIAEALEDLRTTPPSDDGAAALSLLRRIVCMDRNPEKDYVAVGRSLVGTNAWITLDGTVSGLSEDDVALVVRLRASEGAVTVNEEDDDDVLGGPAG